MAESVIADFVGSFNSEVSARKEPTKGRILLSERRLVLAGDEGTVTVPLSAIIDVGVGQVPEGLGEFFNSTVTVAFERDDRQFVAAIEADDEKITKFSNVLFNVLLNGTDVTLQHPERVGGRVTGTSFEAAKTFVRPGTLRFRRADDTVDLSLAAVRGLDRLTREIEGRNRSTLVVHHVADGRSLTTLVAASSARKLSILGRYLRLEYSDRVADLEDVALGDEAARALLAIYSAGPDVPLGDVLDVDVERVATLIATLRQGGLLVDDGDEGLRISPLGRVVVHRRVDGLDV